MLGKRFKQTYGSKFDLFDASGNCRIEKLSVLFSGRQRTILSGLNFIKGMCGTEILAKVIEHYLLPIIPNEEDRLFLRQMNNFDNLFDLDNYLRRLDVSSDLYFHSHLVWVCPAVQIELNKVWSSVDFQKKVSELKKTKEYNEILEKVAS